MPCVLTQNISLDCRESLGGLKSIRFIEFANVTSTTETAGVITAITLAASKKFWKYELAKESSSFTETITSSVANGTLFYAQELSVILNKLQANYRNEILLLAKNNLVAIAEDKNGTFFMLGKVNGLEITGGTAGSGVATGDRNGYELTFGGQEPQLATPVNGAIIAALTNS